MFDVGLMVTGVYLGEKRRARSMEVGDEASYAVGVGE